MQACECQQIKKMKVEAAYSAEPLWSAECFTNLGSYRFSLTESLVTALYEWIGDYGTWIDWNTDGVVAGGVELEAVHNKRGAELAELVKQQLPQFDIVFSPSTYAVRHRED
ncbi:MAG: hypothetical protein ABS882_00435 [Lysinibacillus sp.]